ncbi:MAG: hypothetical protein R3Y40_04900 [Eubacteriales bacterium]
MRKIWKMSLVAMLAFALMGCGSEEEEASVDTTAEAMETQDDTEADGIEIEVEDIQEVSGYYIVVEDVEVFIGATQAETIELISEEPAYFEAASCAYEGTDYMYTYNNCVITFYDEGDDIAVGSITLKNDIIETGEGAYIGQSREEIEAIYGTDYEGDDTAIVYTKDSSEMQFIFSDGYVISILIQAI